MIVRVLLVDPTEPERPSYVVIPNVGLGFLATALRDAGHEVRIADCRLESWSPEELPDRLGGSGYDAVGITLFSTQIRAAERAARALRRAYPNALFAAGGPHPSFESADTLRRLPEVDYAVAGEGEIPFVRLLDERSNPEAIAGVAWRKNETARSTPPDRIPEAELTALPAWDLLRPDRYPLAPNGIFSRGRRVAPVIATRGCPYRCTFCGARKSMGPKVRKRPAARVVDEVEWLRRDFGVDEVHFMDDNFSMHAGYVREFCETLLRRGARMAWACPNGLRLDTLDADLLRLMEQAGCYSMAVGIESGSDETLASIEKHLDTKTIRRQIELIKRETRIRVTGFFIVGLPGETEADIENTIRFSRELPLDRANFFNYSPFPGSSIYESLKESGELNRIDPSDLYIHHVVYSPDQLSIARLRRLQRRAHLAFYLRPRILLGLAREIRSWFQLRILATRALKLLLG